MVYVSEFNKGKYHIVRGNVGNLMSHRWGIDTFTTLCGLQKYFHVATRGKIAPETICKRCVKLQKETGVDNEIIVGNKAAADLELQPPTTDDIDKSGLMVQVLRNNLAIYAHNAWSRWMTHLFTKGTFNPDGTFTIQKQSCDRWIRQSGTNYVDLPASEQKSDLDEADKIISVFAGRL